MAETIVPLDELLNLQDFVREGLPLEDPAAYKDFIDDRTSTARKILAAASEATRSLKKGATDMKSALQAHKTSENLRQNRNAADSAKTKKSKLSQYAATSDPSATLSQLGLINLQHVEELSSEYVALI